jgi:hypothetical protein
VKDPSIKNYWEKNLGTYYRIPKDWFVEKRFENNTSSLYITKDKFDENEQFKIGFSLHYIKDCSTNKIANPTLLVPSKSSEYLITNLAYNLGKTIVKKPYKFKDNHLIGFGVSIKDNNFTSRHISLGDDYNDVCLRMIFEAPNNEWKSVEKIGNTIIESHWRK